jgi:hypothetical protein
LQNPGSFEERKAARRAKWQEALSFGYFSLGKQRKVTENDGFRYALPILHQKINDISER